MSVDAAQPATVQVRPDPASKTGACFVAPTVAAPQASPGSFRLSRLLSTDVLASFPAAAYEQDSLTQDLFGKQRILLAKPSAVRHVMLDNYTNYCRPPASQRTLRPLLGDGVLISEGESWRHQRRTLAPLFAPRVIPMLGEMALTSALAWVDQLAKRTDQSLDMLHEVGELALEIAGRTMFSIDTGEDGRVLRGHLERFTFGLAQPHTLDFLLPLWLPSPYDVARRRFHSKMVRVVARIMDRRLAQPPGLHARDLMELMAQARDPETGAGFSRTQLLDEVTTMLVGGHETTAHGLFWTLYLLASAPREQERLAAEADAVEMVPGRVEQALKELVFTRAVASESLRLYPPGAVINRWALNDDCADGIDIPRGAFVVVSPWLMHHHTRFWNEPYAFDPSRFLPDATPPERFTYIPFGAGPRGCMGGGLAMAELTLVTAALLRRFHVELNDRHEPKPISVIVTRPDRPIQFRLTPRRG
ncbi:MAG: cytochrome P450 [Acetobacteraceae bacterium]